MSTDQSMDEIAETISGYVEQALNEYNEVNGAQAAEVLETLTRHAIFIKALSSALDHLMEPGPIRSEFVSFMNGHHQYLMTRYIMATDLAQDVLEKAAKDSNALIKQIYELQTCLDSGKSH